MKKWLWLALLAWGSVVLAAEPAPALAGHYYLQGVREVGSELLLRADGRFQWMMSYGAVDQAAEGSWSHQGDTVLLKAALPDAEPVFRLFRDEELRIRKPAEAGTWVAIVGMPQVGPMPGVEVTFEGHSGKQVTALTDRNGDAQVAVIAGERWVRAGLRRDGSQAAVQWLVLPAARSEAGIAAFAVNDEVFVRPPAFRELSLRVDGRQLVLDSGSEGSRMVYRRAP